MSVELHTKRSIRGYCVIDRLPRSNSSLWCSCRVHRVAWIQDNTVYCRSKGMNSFVGTCEWFVISSGFKCGCAPSSRVGGPINPNFFILSPFPFIRPNNYCLIQFFCFLRRKRGKSIVLSVTGLFRVHKILDEWSFFLSRRVHWYRVCSFHWLNSWFNNFISSLRAF